MTATDARA